MTPPCLQPSLETTPVEPSGVGPVVKVECDSSSNDFSFVTKDEEDSYESSTESIPSFKEELELCSLYASYFQMIENTSENSRNNTNDGDNYQSSIVEDAIIEYSSDNLAFDAKSSSDNSAVFNTSSEVDDYLSTPESLMAFSPLDMSTIHFNPPLFTISEDSEGRTDESSATMMTKVDSPESDTILPELEECQSISVKRLSHELAVTVANVESESDNSSRKDSEIDDGDSNTVGMPKADSIPVAMEMNDENVPISDSDGTDGAVSVPVQECNPISLEEDPPAVGGDVPEANFIPAAVVEVNDDNVPCASHTKIPDSDDSNTDNGVPDQEDILQRSLDEDPPAMGVQEPSSGRAGRCCGGPASMPSGALSSGGGAGGGSHSSDYGPAEETTAMEASSDSDNSNTDGTLPVQEGTENSPDIEVETVGANLTYEYEADIDSDSSDEVSPSHQPTVMERKRSILFNAKVELITEEHDENDHDKLVVKRVSTIQLSP